MTLDEFNRLDGEGRRTQLMQSCHCESWAAMVAAQTPFIDRQALLDTAEQVWQTVGEYEILEAFAGHPQIGDTEALRNRYTATADAEQGQVFAASEATLAALKAANETYLSRYGFIFIVCASGRSADEMLAMVRDRLENSRTEELVNGAREQAAITQLRLEKIIEE